MSFLWVKKFNLGLEKYRNNNKGDRVLEKTYSSLTRKFPTAPSKTLHTTPVQFVVQGSPLFQFLRLSIGSIRLLFTVSNASTADMYS